MVNYTSPRGAIAAAEVSKSIEATGSKAAVVQANVAVFSDLKNIIGAALTISENGKIDILVHNAATGDDCFLEEMTEEFYQAQTDVNLKGNPVQTLSACMADILLPRYSSLKWRCLILPEEEELFS